MGEKVTITTFSRRFATSRSTVTKYLNAGAIDCIERDEGGVKRKYIDWDTEAIKYAKTCANKKSLAAYHDYLHDTTDDSKKGKKYHIPYNDNVKDARDKNMKDVIKEHGKKIATGSNIDDIDYAHAREIDLIYKAKQTKLNYDKAAGLLITLEEVANEWANLLEELKSSLLGIPDRVSPQFEGMTHREIHTTLTGEIKHTLKSLSTKFADAAEGVSDDDINELI